MGTNSTSVENPVNQIAQLLSDEEATAETSTNGANTAPPAVEAADAAETVKEDETTSDENQENVESLELSDGENQDADEQIETLNNLANDLEIDIADMYALNLNLSNDEQVTLGGLKDFYETNRDIEVERQKLTKQKEDLQVDADAARKAPQLSNELLQARAQVMSIQDQYDRTDWNALRTDNPGNYAALMQDFNQQFNIAKDNERIASEAAETHTSQARQLQQERLFEAMPELKDEKVRQDAHAAVGKFAQHYGFSIDDVGHIDDHRLMRLLIDASRLTQAQDTAKEKQVTTTPKSGKTSASRPVPSSRKSSLKRLTEKAKASGDRRDQTDAVTAIINS